MPEYRVTWEIDVDAEDARSAAGKALEIQRDPDSTTTVFNVSALADFWVSERIDLDECPNYLAGIDCDCGRGHETSH